MARSPRRRLSTSSGDSSIEAVVHELTNVLTVISGAAELLAREARLPASASPKVDLIVTQGRRGAELVRQLRGVPAPSPEGKVRSRPASRETIALLVEDDDAVRAVIEWQLEGLGCRVLSASSGKEALRVCRDHAAPLTFAVLDFVLPEMDGAELYRQLRQAQRDLPAIFLSGGSGRNRQRALAGKRGNRVQWLPKPASLDQLAAAVARAIGRSAQC